MENVSRCLRRGDVLGKKWKQVQQNDFEGQFYLSCSFIFRNERNGMKKSARVSEKFVSPGLHGLLEATDLVVVAIWLSFGKSNLAKTKRVDDNTQIEKNWYKHALDKQQQVVDKEKKANFSTL